ncbi:MAG: AMP-binding protein [Pseudomonadota bacterium]
MLPPSQTYEQLRENFQWKFPQPYNMGWDVCDKWVETDADRTAIIDLTCGSRKDFSFGELKTLSNQLANHLNAKGIRYGDRVGVFRTQSIWTAAAHIAIWKMGAVSIPLFTLFGEEALETRLENSGAKAIVTDAVHAEKQGEVFARLADLEHVIVPEMDGIETLSAEFEIAETNAETPGLIIYTSGTTGPPKGALHAHRVMRGHVPGVEFFQNFPMQGDDVFWTPADWAWIGGLMNILMPSLYNGIPVVASAMTKFNGKECQQIINDGGVRNVFFPPTALRILKAEGNGLSGLRSVGCGGEPLGEEMLNWGRENLGLTINEFYGQTECNLVLATCNNLFEPKPGFIGKQVPGFEVAVIDESGDLTDEEGDIAVRRGCASMMLEYWNNPKATKEKFRQDKIGEDWLLTGDRGVREGEYFRFVGRDDDVITSAGYRIGPAEIENCMLKHEAVASVGVIGKPDEERTEIVKAYVLLKDGYRGSDDLVGEMRNFVRTRLSAHEYPREIEFVDALPMTVTGKIIRKELKARATKELENQ